MIQQLQTKGRLYILSNVKFAFEYIIYYAQEKSVVCVDLSLVLDNAFNKLEDGHRNACLTALTEYESGLASGMAESH